MNARLQIIFIIQVSTSENRCYTIRQTSTHSLRSTGSLHGHVVDVAQNTRFLCPFLKIKYVPDFSGTYFIQTKRFHVIFSVYYMCLTFSSF